MLQMTLKLKMLKMKSKFWKEEKQMLITEKIAKIYEHFELHLKRNVSQCKFSVF